MELVVNDLVDNGVAISLPHASHDLAGHDDRPRAVFHQEEATLTVLRGREGGERVIAIRERVSE